MSRIDTIEDIKLLHGRHEDREIEIKSAPPHLGSLVQSIQSFLNGDKEVAHIIIGLGEGKDKKINVNNEKIVTYPIKLSDGRSINNFHDYRLQILQSLKSQTDDYKDNLVSIYELTYAPGFLLVIKICKSDRLHQNSQNGIFYIRRDGRKDFMTIHELRERLISERLPDIGEQFLNTEVIKNNGQWNGCAHLYIKISPQNKNDFHINKTDLEKLIKSDYLLRSFGKIDDIDTERNRYGVKVFNPVRNGSSIIECFTQVFESGEILGLNAHILKDDRYTVRYVPSVALEKTFIDTLNNYIDFSVKKLKLTPPFKVNLALHNVHGYVMGHQSFWNKFDGEIVDDNVSDEAILEDVGQNVAELLRPFFEKVWDACGLKRPEKL